MSPFMKTDPCPCVRCSRPDLCDMDEYGCYDLECWKDRVKDSSEDMLLSGHGANLAPMSRVHRRMKRRS